MRKSMFKRKVRKKFFGLLLTVSMLAGMLAVPVSAADSAKGSEEEPLASILTLADYQKYDSTGDRFDILCAQFENLVESADNAGVSPEYMIFGGDFSCQNSVDFSLQGMSQVKTILRNTWSNLTNDKMVMVQGNHDPSGTPGITPTGPVEYEDFIVYVINNDDYPDKQNIDGSQEIVEQTVADLTAWFDEKIEEGETRPVFVATHAGLHFDIDRTNGNNQYAYLLFDAINEAAQNLDIVYFFGHNHTNGDEQVGGSITYYQPGDYLNVCTETSIANKSGTPKMLDFTYMNYGYVGYVGDITNNETEIEPTDILVITNLLIYEDRIELRRYGYDGVEEKYSRTIERYFGDDERYSSTVEKPPVLPEVLADFDFDSESENGVLDGGNAKATGTYSLIEHDDGYALKLNGNGQYLRVTDKDGNSLLTDVTEMTVSFDVYATGDESWLFYTAPDSDTQEYMYEKYISIFDKEGTLTAERYLSNNNDRPVLPSVEIDTEKWQKVTAVYKNGETILYLDGVQVAKTSSVVDVQTLLGENSVLYIGRANWGSGEYCTNYIDNYKVYSYALTGKEVADEAGVKYTEPVEPITYTQVTNLEAISPDEQYVLAFWRYFGGTEADSTNAYLLQSENKNDLRARTDDAYKTIIYSENDGVIPDKALWKLTAVNGGYTIQNVETEYYLGKDLIYDSVEPVVYNLGSGICDGYRNFALGIDKYCIRHNNSTSSFILIQSTVDTEVAHANACNVTIYKVNVPQKDITLPYEDVEEGSWYYDGVYYNYVAGTMTGKSDTIFAPDESLARGQFASILYRIEGSPEVQFKPEFADVEKDIWYTAPILWAKSEGIVNGYANGSFGPGDMITREQMAIMMYNYAVSKGYDVSETKELSAFKDAASVSEYAVDEVKWAVGAGIISGKENGTLLDPQGETARAQCAVIIKNFMEKYAE